MSGSSSGERLASTQRATPIVLPPLRLHSLDLARGVAAIAIVLWHWQHFFFVGLRRAADFRSADLPAHASLASLYDYGYLAVSLFFTLSGFIFFWLYSGKVSNGSLSLRVFFIQRISRLLPLHIATLLVVAVAQWAYRSRIGSDFVYPTGGTYRFVLNGLLLSIADGGDGMSFNGPSWSLSVEMVLYAVFFLYCSATLPRLVSMIAVAAGSVLIVAHFKETLGVSMASFFAGGTVWAVYNLLLRAKRLTRACLAIDIAAISGWGVALWCATRGTPGGALLSGLGSSLVITLGLFPLTILALALTETARPAVFARLARTTRLGEISYSAFMIHFPLQLLIMLALSWFGGDAHVFYSPLSLLAFLAALVGCSLLSHYHFERPAQRWIRSIARTD